MRKVVIAKSVRDEDMEHDAKEAEYYEKHYGRDESVKREIKDVIFEMLEEEEEHGTPMLTGKNLMDEVQGRLENIYDSSRANYKAEDDYGWGQEDTQRFKRLYPGIIKELKLD
jgi:hypothetical protein